MGGQYPFFIVSFRKTIVKTKQKLLVLLDLPATESEDILAISSQSYPVCKKIKRPGFWPMPSCNCCPVTEEKAKRWTGVPGSQSQGSAYPGEGDLMVGWRKSVARGGCQGALAEGGGSCPWRQLVKAWEWSWFGRNLKSEAMLLVQCGRGSCILWNW